MSGINKAFFAMNNVSEQKKWLRRLQLSLQFSALLLVAMLMLLHMTDLRAVADPLGSFLDARTVASAETDTQKASALLTINDRLLADLNRLRTEHRFEAGQKKLSQRIVQTNEQIIALTNRAKDNGIAVRVLLERIEKTLATQHESLGEKYPDAQEVALLGQQHDYILNQYNAVLGVQSDASKVHHH